MCTAGWWTEMLSMMRLIPGGKCMLPSRAVEEANAKNVPLPGNVSFKSGKNN